MPAGAIQEHDSVSAGGDPASDFLQVQAHGLRRAAGQHESGSFAVIRADRAEDVGRLRSLIVRR